MLGAREIEAWLRESDPARLAELFAEADRVRAANVGDAVHVRGLVELSNHCVRACLYCGIRRGIASLARYRIQPDEVIECARFAREQGYGTLVMQAGEDPALSVSWLVDVIERIKAETGLAVTLSLGERPLHELRALRAAGADRYLLRFETSDRELFSRIHPMPEEGATHRLALLPLLRELGYEAGSGVMVGIPGQSYASLAADIALFGELELHMIGLGPYIPQPGTPLADRAEEFALPEGEQVPNDTETGFKALALARLVRPEANIPATTAFATLDPAAGRRLGLERGANVVMPNLTPERYRRLYAIYPDKAASREDARASAATLTRQLTELGRPQGSGAGNCASYVAP